MKICGILKEKGIYSVESSQTAGPESAITFSKRGNRKPMEEKEIIELFFLRSDNAIAETQKQYGALLTSISSHILKAEQDVEECVNDTYLAVWNQIPPKRPESLKAYVCSVVKHLSLKRHRHNHAAKRSSEYEQSLDELEGCIPSGNSVEAELDRKELERSINAFLSKLSPADRKMFLLRYWFLFPVKEIADRYHTTEKNASMKLSRIRKKLKSHLNKEGYSL